MLTIFSTPKPFRGHIDIIQRNALQSWKLLHPDIEIILFGDDAGAADVCAELGLRYEPHVERNEHGTKFLRSIFHRAQDTARHNLICYSNCDIILTDDFRRAVERVSSWRKPFLMVGRRWDTDISWPIDFHSPDWASQAVQLAVRSGRQRDGEWIDYFAFSRGLYRNIPPLVIGRIAWDRWLIRNASASGATIVDASSLVVAVHQNHDYSYHPQGASGVWQDHAANLNIQIAGPSRDLYTIDDATYILTPRGFRYNSRHLWLPFRRSLRPLVVPAWHALLGATRPLRHLFGLRQENLSRFLEKMK